MRFLGPLALLLLFPFVPVHAQGREMPEIYPVPTRQTRAEPNAALLVLTGIAGIAVVRRRQQPQ